MGPNTMVRLLERSYHRNYIPKLFSSFHLTSLHRLLLCLHPGLSVALLCFSLRRQLLVLRKLISLLDLPYTSNIDCILCISSMQ